MHNLTGHSKEIFTLRWTPVHTTLNKSSGGSSNSNSNSSNGVGGGKSVLPLYLCTASFDGCVKVWEGLSGHLVYTLNKYAQPVYSVSPNPSGT